MITKQLKQGVHKRCDQYDKRTCSHNGEWFVTNQQLKDNKKRDVIIYREGFKYDDEFNKFENLMFRIPADLDLCRAHQKRYLNRIISILRKVDRNGESFISGLDESINLTNGDKRFIKNALCNKVRV